jgi:thiol-disulfide isomerase/thioredoxin
MLGTVLAVTFLQAADLKYVIHGLTKESHISGPELSEKDFKNKVIFIEIWGIHCPPCRASLKGMGDLGRKYAKDNRVLIIGSHAQNGTKEEVRKLLEQNKCEYPVYQNLGTSVAPGISGIPHAYIIDHKGNRVWNGHPSHAADILENYIKQVPTLDPKSILDGYELKAFKAQASNLRVGKNVERTIKLIEDRIARDPKVATEGQEIIDLCYRWADGAVEEISNNLDTYPSRAFIAYQALAKTFPSKAAEFKESFAVITKDKLTGSLVKSRLELEKKKALPTNTPNLKKRAFDSLRMPKSAIDSLVKRLGDDVTEDALDVQRQWQELYDTLKP